MADCAERLALSCFGVQLAVHTDTQYVGLALGHR